MDRLSLGVIGAGLMGSLHARAIAETPYATISAVADSDLGRAEDLARRHGAAAYADHRQMLDAERLHAVVVCTPETLHRDPVIDAAVRGYGVLVEKPLATSLQDADAMIDACRRHDVPLMVGYILRFEPAYARIKEAVTNGMIGRFLSAYGRRDAPIAEGERLAGRTSVLNYLAVHDADQMLWYNPTPVLSVTAKAIRGRMAEAYGVADFVWTMMEFADGSLGVIESGWALAEEPAEWSRPAGRSAFRDAEMNVIGTHGVLALDFAPMNLSRVDGDGSGGQEPRYWPVVDGRIGGALRAEMDHFLGCVATGRPPLIDGGEARRSLEVALAAERSITAGGEVALPLAEGDGSQASVSRAMVRSGHPALE